MTTLTDKFTAFETQVGVNHAELMAALIDMQAALDLVASNTDIALENGAANTKAILAALGQTGACFPCPTPSIIVPPIGTTPSPINTDKCQRSQAIIATIEMLLANMDTLQSFNVIGSYNVITDAISEIIGTIAAGDTIPLPSFPEGVNIVGDYISYAGERLFSGVGLVEQFTPLESAMIAGLAFSSDASGAQAVYNGIIDASSASNGAKLLFKALAYTALWTYYFDPDSMPDLSGYDGEACGGGLQGIVACQDFASSYEHVNDHDESFIDVPVHFDGTPFGIEGDYYHWTMDVLEAVSGHPVSLYWHESDGTSHLLTTDTVAAPTYTIEVHTFGISILCLDFDNPDTAFVVRICPPLE